MILIFGILGFLVCGFFGIAAWIMGNNDLKEMAAGTMDPSGRGTTQAGKICGMIATILMAIGAVVGLLLALGFGGAILSQHH